ncbi:MAG: hypothetical protein AB7I30_11910 [Isosphaeraceae bacterium]
MADRIAGRVPWLRERDASAEIDQADPGHPALESRDERTIRRGVHLVEEVRGMGRDDDLGLISRFPRGVHQRARCRGVKGGLRSLDAY